MKLKTVPIFLLLVLNTSLYSFDVTSYLQSTFSYIIAPLSLFTWLTDHFVLATRQDLLDAQDEVIGYYQETRRGMQEIAQKNSEKLRDAIKKELTDLFETQLLSYKKQSITLQRDLIKTKKMLIQKIKSTHKFRMKSLKRILDSHTQSIEKKNALLMQKITQNTMLQIQEFEQKNRDILIKFTGIMKRCTDKYRSLKEATLLHNKEHINVLDTLHKQKIEEIKAVTNTYDEELKKTEEKLEEIESVILLLKKRRTHNQVIPSITADVPTTQQQESMSQQVVRYLSSYLFDTSEEEG